MTEALICMGIVAMLAALAFTSGYHYRLRSQAKECRGNIQMLYQAVNEYAIDYQLAPGATVTVSQLMPRYLRAAAGPTCPATTGVSYGAFLIVNKVPACPAGIAEHAWSPAEQPGF